MGLPSVLVSTVPSPEERKTSVRKELLHRSFFPLLYPLELHSFNGPSCNAQTHGSKNASWGGSRLDTSPPPLASNHILKPPDC